MRARRVGVLTSRCSAASDNRPNLRRISCVMALAGACVALGGCGSVTTTRTVTRPASTTTTQDAAASIKAERKLTARFVKAFHAAALRPNPGHAGARCTSVAVAAGACGTPAQQAAARKALGDDPPPRAFTVPAADPPGSYPDPDQLSCRPGYVLIWRVLKFDPNAYHKFLCVPQ